MTSKRFGRRSAKRAGPIGVNIKRLRGKVGLSQEALAEKAGIHRMTIAQLENGTHQTAAIDTVTKVAEALRVKVSDITHDEEGVTVTPVEPLLDEFRDDPWGRITKPTNGELDWLRGLPGIIWIDCTPTPETLHHMVEAYRTRKK